MRRSEGRDTTLKEGVVLGTAPIIIRPGVPVRSM